MPNIGIFIFGCIVFAVVVASTFCALLASDHPDRPL